MQKKARSFLQEIETIVGAEEEPIHPAELKEQVTALQFALRYSTQDSPLKGYGLLTSLTAIWIYRYFLKLRRVWLKAVEALNQPFFFLSLFFRLLSA